VRCSCCAKSTGLNTAETAQQLRVSEATVKTPLHRAKALLQRKLHAVTPVRRSVSMAHAVTGSSREPCVALPA
jgi:hypothetical protein